MSAGETRRLDRCPTAAALFDHPRLVTARVSPAVLRANVAWDVSSTPGFAVPSVADQVVTRHDPSDGKGSLRDEANDVRARAKALRG